MKLDCSHFDRCSGCSRNEHLDHPKVLIEAQNFFAAQGLHSFPFHANTPWEWRCRAKLAVRGSSSLPLIGLFEENSHRVVDIPRCRVHHPSLNLAANILRKWLIEQKIEPYDENSGKGFLRYIQVTVEKATQRVQLVLVLNEKPTVVTAEFEEICRETLLKQNPLLWHSLWFNFNSGKDNVIFGKEWRLIEGEAWLWETLQGKEICFHPASFMQANLDMFDSLLERIKTYVPKNASLLEFYAGVGSIGISLAEYCQRIRCVEIVSQAKICFEQSLQRLPIHLSKKLSFICGSASEFASLLDPSIDVAIVDPPRKGLDRLLLQALIQAVHLQRLIYVSCGWESFQRDCLALCNAGWELSHAEAFLFFPGSEHLEILAVFEK